jgi:hypothetical protein
MAEAAASARTAVRKAPLMQELKGRRNMGVCVSRTCRNSAQYNRSRASRQLSSPISPPCTRMDTSDRKEKLCRCIGFAKVSSSGA